MKKQEEIKIINDIAVLKSAIIELYDIINQLKIENHSHVHYEIKHLLVNQKDEAPGDNFPPIFFKN